MVMTLFSGKGIFREIKAEKRDLSSVFVIFFTIFLEEVVNPNPYGGGSSMYLRDAKCCHFCRDGYNWLKI